MGYSPWGHKESDMTEHAQIRWNKEQKHRQINLMFKQRYTQ